MFRKTGSSDGAMRPPDVTYRAWRRLLREEDAWLLRQIASIRPVLWLRRHPPGPSARHGILSLRPGLDGRLRGAVRASAEHWPWADGSVPAIVLQHVCEGSDLDRRILAEASRVLAPEGRLYVLRFDRFSPWYWRFGSAGVVRGGAPRVLGRRLHLAEAQARGLALEYRHALGSRGLRDSVAGLPGTERAPERWPLVTSLRATRIWVLRKRSRQWVLPGRRPAPVPVPAGYGLARVVNERDSLAKRIEAGSGPLIPPAGAWPPDAIRDAGRSTGTTPGRLSAAALFTGMWSTHS